MKPVLTAGDFIRAAATLQCEAAVIRAFAEKESRGGGFLKGQILTVRFEGHIFRRETDRKFDSSNPTLSHKYMPNCPYNRGTISDWRRLEQARQLAGDVAFECASYGRFQIMGFHYKMLGYDSAYAMVQAFNVGEAAHLDAFVRFCQTQGLVPLLRARNWLKLAERYNGLDNASNNYAPELEALYEHYRPDYPA
jgi:hypothetical protein